MWAAHITALLESGHTVGIVDNILRRQWDRELIMDNLPPSDNLENRVKVRDIVTEYCFPNCLIQPPLPDGL